MRCFIAIDIDETVKAAMGDVRVQLERTVDLRRGDVKWVRPEAMHLTLKFLGETPDADVVKLCEATERVAERHKAFELEIAGVGHFGGRNARVLWVGAREGEELLKALQQDLEDELEQAGWPKEGRRFSAHLTLCHIKRPPAGYKLAQAAESYRDWDCGVTPVNTLTVYQSELRPQGPLYTALGRFSMLDA